MALGTAILEFLFWSIEKSFNYLKEYFFPTPQLPDEIMDEIEQEAHEFIWNMHRCEEQDMGDYYIAIKYLYKQKYDEYFAQ
tara:strand:- start:1755 stop:1997 length:243 start_codon:yes stop_codon:yes gene_type:complete